ncbi:hypothetical protein LX36DRAFT_404676 [Colletotrichum falcatum]|nr:hypothetical protein LX36DRAFT_404676 [Colletotrichum falcatum]
MNSGSSLGDDDFPKAPSTREPWTPIHERPKITRLPGVFVPSCQNGSIIYPTTTQKNPTAQRRVSFVPPAPSTTLNCSLLSRGGDVAMDWAPQASAVFRRPSRCMSMEETGCRPHSPTSVEDFVGKAEPADVSSKKDRPAKEASVRAPADIASAKDSDPVSHDPRVVLPEQNALGRPGYSLWGKSHIRVQRIMLKVREHLAGSRKAEAVSTQGQETDLPAACSREPCQYVLDDSQVQGIVEMVFQEIRKHETSSQNAPAAEDYREINDSAPRCLTRKPSCLRSSIEPQPSTTAGPATTISEPETSFVARRASDGQVYSKTRPQQITSTTIVCQGGSTDIQWPDNNEASPKVFKSSQNKENVEELTIPSDEDQSCRITSFPALSKRHCTNDWLSPPMSFMDSKSGTDMYHLGIDARSRSIASITRGLPEKQLDAKKPSRRASEAVVDMKLCETTDSLLASAECGRRRSAQLADTLTPEQPDPSSGFMQKFTRKISSVFQSSDSVNRPTRAPAPSEIEGHVSGRFTEALGASRPAGDQGPDAGSFSEPEPDAVYQAMTLLKPSKGESQRRSTCSEDNMPHRCEDDLSTLEVPTPCAQPTP